MNSSVKQGMPRLLAVSLWSVCLGLVAVALGVVFSDRPFDDPRGWALVVTAVIVLAVSTFSLITIWARSAVGWVFSVIALVLALALLAQAYLDRSTPGGRLDFAREALVVADGLAIPAIALAAPFALLLASPGGRRPILVALSAIASGSALVLLALTPGRGPGISASANPIGLDALEGMRRIALAGWFVVAAGTALLAALSYAQSRRRSEPEEEASEPAERRRRRLLWRRQRQSPWYFFKDLRRVAPYLRPYWKLGIASTAMIGVGVLAGLLAPWPLAILVDTVLGDKPLPSILGSFFGSWDPTTLLIFVVVAGLLVTAVDNGLGVLSDYVNVQLEQRMVLDLRSDLFAHAQSLSQAFHDQSRTGHLMYVINNQAHAVGSITVAIPPLVQALATLVGMFLIAYRIDAQLALLSLTIVPFIYYSVGYYAKRIEPRLQDVQGMEGQSLSIVHEAMSMLRVIVAFGRETHEHRRFRKQGEQAVDARVKLTVRQTMFSLGVNTITAAGTALVLGFGGWHVMQGQLTVGELLVVIAYIAAVYQPLQEISGTVASLQLQFVQFRAALWLLDMEPEIKEAPDAISIDRAQGAVAFENVNFTYKDRVDTLKDICFEALPGQQIGIVGPTGAGKTTLASLIPRFYDPEAGRVLLDGIDVRNLTLESLRRQISVVHQEPLLFSGTIEENIRYGRLDADTAEIVDAAKAANAHDFIDGLPNQYGTVLGEGGPQLSGGERQRVAIARAFLKDAPILILDEPTAAVDSKTEAVILDALDRLMEGRTTFLIAHRLSTLRSAALILVVDHGEIIERGTHEELLEVGGLYRQLWEAQTRERRLRVVGAPPAEEPVTEGTPMIGAPEDVSGRDDAAGPLVAALKVLLDSSPDALTRLGRDTSQPLEVRLAAGMLAALTREELDELRKLDEARLTAALMERDV